MALSDYAEVLHLRGGAHERGVRRLEAELSADMAVIAVLANLGDQFVTFQMFAWLAALVVDEKTQVIAQSTVHVAGTEHEGGGAEFHDGVAAAPTEFGKR
jgi:hypothetical protein